MGFHRLGRVRMQLRSLLGEPSQLEEGKAKEQHLEADSSKEEYHYLD